MKILAVSCSPRKESTNVILLNEVLRGAKDDGAEVELYSVAGKNLQPCDGCWACRAKGVCPIKDDMPALFDKMVAADAIVFGVPIYYYGMAAQAKLIIDRSISLGLPGRSLTNKIGGVVAMAGSFGLVDAIKDFCFFFFARRMLMGGYVAAYGGNVDELKKMEKCLKAANNLGHTMVALAKMNFKYPTEIMGPSIAYGTHTK